MLHFLAACVACVCDMLRWSARAGLTLLSLKVYAVGKMKKDDPCPVRAKDLSLYSVPPFEARFVEEPRSSLEEAISKLRKAMEPYAAWFQAFYSKTKPTVDVAIQQGTASCDHFWNSPPEVFRRLSVIGLSGVLGYFLAGRSKLKKLVYPCALVGVTSSVYYPQDAIGVAVLVGEKLCVWGSVALGMLQDTWNKYFQGDLKPEKPGEAGDLFKRRKK